MGAHVYGSIQLCDSTIGASKFLQHIPLAVIHNSMLTGDQATLEKYQGQYPSVKEITNAKSTKPNRILTKKTKQQTSPVVGDEQGPKTQNAWPVHQQTGLLRFSPRCTNTSKRMRKKGVAFVFAFLLPWTSTCFHSVCVL